MNFVGGLDEFLVGGGLVIVGWRIDLAGVVVGAGVWE